MKLTLKEALKVYHHTPIIYLLSTSLASCNLKNGFRRFVPHIIRNPILSAENHCALVVVECGRVSELCVTACY